MTALIAQSTKSSYRTPDPVADYQTRIYVGWAAAILLLVLIALYARMRWIRIRPKVNAAPEGSADRVKPGYLAENLALSRWEQVFGQAVKRAEASLAADASPITAQAAAALRATGTMQRALAEATRDAALGAVQTGELQTRLIANDSAVVYALVFPDKHPHARLIRRYPAFTDGWLDHVAHVRRGLTDKGHVPDLLCLLFFFGPDARDGTLAIAYEANDGRLAAAELVDGDGGGDDRPLRRTDTWSFLLANTTDDVTAA